MMRQSAPRLPAVYLITDRKIATPEIYSAIGASLKGGVRMIQLREKDLSTAEVKQMALKILNLAQPYAAKLLLNSNPELAAEVGADGVQLGVHTCSITHARAILGEQALIGYSAHSPEEVLSAAAQGADFVTFSPIYATASKVQYGPPQGLAALKKLCLAAPLPVYALGGIKLAQIRDIFNTGAYGVALISAIFAATDVQRTTEQLLQEVQISTAS